MPGELYFRLVLDLRPADDPPVAERVKLFPIP
jgi:hypothetical protein